MFARCTLLTCSDTQGELKGTKAAVEGEVCPRLKPGAYFGELALIKNQPRAATITAVTDCKCLVMDRAAFTRLLGPMNDILARQADVYHKCVGVVLGAMAHAVTLVVFVAQV